MTVGADIPAPLGAAGILARIPSRKVLVVGDVCLDRWCTYDPDLAEPSRETGIPRTAVIRTEITAGAGGTVANNLAALGAGEVCVLGICGNDGHGFELLEALRTTGIRSDLMVKASVPTFTYTKLLNARTGDEDLARIDYVNPGDVPPELEEEIVSRLTAAAGSFDAILVSDQAETDRGGVVTSRVRQAVSSLGRDKLVWVDSRLRAERFRGVLVKPNEREAREACDRLGIATFRELRNAIGHPRMLVTHGPDGVLVLDGDRESWVKTRPVENPVDICGAGDSFSAGAVLALSCGASLEEAAFFGNCVASVTIMKKGTGTASPAEVLRAEQEIRL